MATLEAKDSNSGSYCPSIVSLFGPYYGPLKVFFLMALLFGRCKNRRCKWGATVCSTSCAYIIICSVLTLQLFFPFLFQQEQNFFLLVSIQFKLKNAANGSSNSPKRIFSLLLGTKIEGYIELKGSIFEERGFLIYDWGPGPLFIFFAQKHVKRSCNITKSFILHSVYRWGAIVEKSPFSGQYYITDRDRKGVTESVQCCCPLWLHKDPNAIVRCYYATT